MANLHDISITGGRLQGCGLPEVGSLLRLAPTFCERGRRWVFAQVCWLRRGEVEEAGVRFLEPGFRLQQSWVGEFASSTPERRSALRVTAQVHLELRLAGQRRSLEATSLDLSQGGAQILLPGHLRSGTQADVSLCLPWDVLDLQAQVVRPADLENPCHSLRFLGLSAEQQEGLVCFLRETTHQQASQVVPDLFWARFFERQ
jgi:hypothetical protein